MVSASFIAGAMFWSYQGPGPEYESDQHSHIKKTLAALGHTPGKPIVLLTGAAGFVGFHTTMEMLRRGTTVIGLDNFNHYYDVNLKHTRAAKLKKAGMTTLFRGDVCDGDLLKLLMKEGHVTRVIHLAAQAGVRYSLKKPLAYVEANVRCFVTMLEAVKEVDKTLPITYASSSSVYGLNTEIPFSEKHRIESQASLYGATKEANERIAHVYHHLHGLKLTGLRFFTVYGPIGRPDMAYFSFTQAIVAGKRITEYRKDDGTELQRDFTYVSDIVEGVIAASELGAPLEVFNLGNTRPEKVSTLIHLLEEGLGKKANITQAPISAGDVPMTFADVSHARERLGYRPRVSLREGVSKFLAWYSEYYKVPLASSFKLHNGKEKNGKAWRKTRQSRRNLVQRRLVSTDRKQPASP